MARRHPIKGRVRHARATVRGMRASKIGPLKFVKMVIQDALENHAVHRQSRRTRGKAAYKVARKRDKEVQQYYRRKWEY